jgi:hypothetical protein
LVGWLSRQVAGKLTIYLSLCRQSPLNQKNQLRAAIVRRQLGPIVDWVAMDHAPRLTSHYQVALERHKETLQGVRDMADAILRSLTISDLIEQYGHDGTASADGLKPVWDPLRHRLAFIRDLNPVFRAGLGDPDFAADYQYWSRMERLQIEEILWLCVGLDPRANWDNALRLNHKLPPREHRERTYMLAIREQLTRAAKSITGSRIDFSAPELLKWMRATEFPAHPGFLDCLEKIVRRRSGAPPPTPLEDAGGTDPREIASMAKILTAIAIREYGYQPGSKKSPIPKEIEAICDEEGLPVSRETILKYLRIGARQRSEDG